MRKFKRFVIIGLGAGAALGLVGAVASLVGYHAATKIDRSVTTAVVRQYIDEMLVRRDDEKASLFTCDDRSGLAAFVELRNQLEREERVSGTTTQIVPARLTESEESQVVVDLKINQGSGLHVDRRSQIWRFSLKNEDGWRVCSAEQLPDPTPTPSATPPTAS